MTYGEQLDKLQQEIEKHESTFSSYAISEQKVFYTKLGDLTSRQQWLIRMIEDYGKDYDPARPSPICHNVKQGFN